MSCSTLMQSSMCLALVRLHGSWLMNGVLFSHLLSDGSVVNKLYEDYGGESSVQQGMNQSSVQKPSVEPIECSEATTDDH
mmetsp:Transcript_24748/g.29964  ORF Transcript_24748/g.29964 Transcript_24748/m.29964 type:complete len:80 (+) Transcript_24748:663-902(+)